MLDAHTTNSISHAHTHARNRLAVIPTTEKLRADRRFSGQGVCVAFLDSGFYPHPDFIDRVAAFHDVSGEEKSLAAIHEPKGHHWHGTQTVVSCAGDGCLSDGVYRGLAYRANLVLVKVSEGGRIGDTSIEKGLRWVLKNREKYGIRVLNMSLGGDMDAATAESTINQLAEELIDAGVVITVAAGNSSDTRPIPPANAPSVITVGGYSDENQFESGSFELYHSSFGTTADGTVKPELIAPAMYVAAPILPGTPDYEAAEMLSLLASAPEYQFRFLLKEYWRAAELNEDVLYGDVENTRKIVDQALRRRKVVATHYQHVDGTSFAAPITASVAAQMLEANPRLTPPIIKNILVSTATRLAGNDAVRQGYGVLNAALAVEKAQVEEHFLTHAEYRGPRVERDRIVFFHHDDSAGSVSLAGDFIGWDKVVCARNGRGLWQAEIPRPGSGRYRYKFLVDGERWIEDASHGFKEEDGFGGFHSVLVVGNPFLVSRRSPSQPGRRFLGKA